MNRLGRCVLFATVSAIALTAGATIGLRARTLRNFGVQRHESNAPSRSAAVSAAGIDTSSLTRRFLLYYIIPIWLAAGVADWICHRGSAIEQTTGAKESLMHLLMLAEVSIPVTAGFFLEVTAPIAALMIAAFLAHEVTALWDVSYAVTAPNVTPTEQHVHSFLEMVPLMAISFIAVLHWPQFCAIAGISRGACRSVDPCQGQALTGGLYSNIARRHRDLGGVALFGGALSYVARQQLPANPG